MEDSIILGSVWYYTAFGSNNCMIDERTKKARTATISIMSLCSDVTLGYHRVKVLIMLYVAIFIAAVLFNSQVWSNITITQETKLQTAQLKFLKRTIHAPNSTSNAFTFLEFGVLPIRYEIHKRKLMFYHHIYIHCQQLTQFSRYTHNNSNCPLKRTGQMR